MSKKILKFELNRDGVKELLRSDEMLSICEEYANKALDKLDDGYSVSTHTGKNRVNASVHADTYAAKKDNLKNNTILKAVGK